jgi:uncharacterized protein (TIGR00251 family)
VPGEAVRPRWLGGGPGDWRLALWVQPGAAHTGVVGEHDGCLRLNVAAPPVDGRANEAICRFLSDTLGLPRAAISVEQGRSSRRKRVCVAADCAASDIRSRLVRA